MLMMYVITHPGLPQKRDDVEEIEIVDTDLKLLRKGLFSLHNIRCLGFEIL